MSDYIDEIDACLKSDIADGLAKEIYGYTTVEEMGELITRLRQAEKDAARYRWLRDSNSDYSVSSVLAKQESEWDSAIDEAMKCEQ